MSFGIGLALANSSGLAYADSDTESSVSASRDADRSTSGPRRSGIDRPTPTQAGDTADEAVELVDQELEDPEIDEDPSEPSGPDPDLPDETDPSGPHVDTERPILPVDSETASNSGGGTSGRDSGRAIAVEDDPEDSAAGLDETATVIDDDVTDESSDETVSNNVETQEITVVDAAPTTSSASRASASRIAEEDTENVNIVAALVSSVISPFADPAAPAQAPWFDALLAWVRRQITHTFFNKTPVVGPVRTEQIITGQILVDIPAYDPNGDPLTYRIVQPKYGLVHRDLITGKFIYTPTSIVTGGPITDTFKVVVSDSSEHLTGGLGAVLGVLHTIAKIFGIAQADTVTVTVPLTVDPIVKLPPAVVTIGAPLFRLGGSPVRVISSASITDLDSDQLSGATVRIATGAKTGDVLGLSAIEGNPITGTWDAETMTLTLSGAATIAQYEAALKAVTFTTTEGGLPRALTISVTDEAEVGSLVPGAALVTVIGLPPAVVTIGAPLFRLGGSPVRVISSASITDLDSDQLSGATVRIATGAKTGDVLGFSAIEGNPITGTWDANTMTLTLSGVATIAQYEAALKAVTFATTEGGLPRGLSVSVTDEAEVASLVPGAALVTVIGLPPAVVTIGAPLFRLGGSPVRVITSASITDLDSDQLSGATVRIATGAKTGDVLGFTAIEGNPITGTWDAQTLTLTLSGLATIAQYEAALKAITFSTTEGGVPRGLTVSVTDEAEVASLVPGAALVTVIGLPPAVVTIGAPLFRLGGSPVRVITSASITDLDSDQLSGATVRIANGAKTGDVLGFDAIEGNPITASW
ncbi:hypothetical protein, partial [Mycobacterium sp. SMC-4]|uniref:hypothetical protein n=1 Tax=Mycobacterium sp. SMC-4 TaxID=2857059 RepID=UPI003CFFBA10